MLLGRTALARYFYYSVVVTVVDTGIVWFLTRFSVTSLVAANTLGVVSGFILHYVLASRSVFGARYDAAGFAIYLGTFLAGLGFANWLIYVSYHYVFMGCPLDLRILFSKGVSVAVPFFAMYYGRKFLFGMLNKRG